MRRSYYLRSLALTSSSASVHFAAQSRPWIMKICDRRSSKNMTTFDREIMSWYDSDIAVPGFVAWLLCELWHLDDFLNVWILSANQIPVQTMCVPERHRHRQHTQPAEGWLKSHTIGQVANNHIQLINWIVNDCKWLWCHKNSNNNFNY